MLQTGGGNKTKITKKLYANKVQELGNNTTILIMQILQEYSTAQHSRTRTIRPEGSKPSYTMGCSLAPKRILSSSGISTSSPTDVAMATFSSTERVDLYSVDSSISGAPPGAGAATAALADAAFAEEAFATLAAT
jgi:hypothetical protein